MTQVNGLSGKLSSELSDYSGNIHSPNAAMSSDLDLQNFLRTANGADQLQSRPILKGVIAGLDDSQAVAAEKLRQRASAAVSDELNFAAPLTERGMILPPPFANISALCSPSQNLRMLLRRLISKHRSRAKSARSPERLQNDEESAAFDFIEGGGSPEPRMIEAHSTALIFADDDLGENFDLTTNKHLSIMQMLTVLAGVLELQDFTFSRLRFPR